MTDTLLIIVALLQVVLIGVFAFRDRSVRTLSNDLNYLRARAIKFHDQLDVLIKDRTAIDKLNNTSDRMQFSLDKVVDNNKRLLDIVESQIKESGFNS